MTLIQLNHWMEYAAGATDVVLLLRVLALRLQRTYVFLTLACVLTVLSDAAVLFLTSESSPERLRVEIYSSLLIAFVFPLAAWDVFEEIDTSMAAFRRTAILRTLTSLLMVTFFGIVLASPTFHAEDPTALPFLMTVTILVSTGSATGCLTFFWAMRRALRAQKISPPRNTFVWMIFYTLLLASQILTWLLLLMEDALTLPSSGFATQFIILALDAFGMVITIWCAVRLRALPKDVPSTSLNEQS